MTHHIQSEGFGIRLRPVQMADSPFIVWLRNQEHALGRVGDSAVDVQKQQAWLEEYFQRAGDYYFIIETSNRIPLGTYGIYDLIDGSAESGRWIVRADVPAAVPSAVLGLDIAFGVLTLKELRATTVSTNQRVLSLNRKFGFRQIRVDPGAQNIGGKPVDLVRFVLEAKEWPAVKEKLLPMARLAAQQVSDWEKEQKS